MLKEKKNKTITVRLTDEDFNYLQKTAYAMGTDASKLVRQLVQMSINAAKESENIRKRSEEKSRDDAIAAFNNIESGVVVNDN